MRKLTKLKSACTSVILACTIVSGSAIAEQKDYSNMYKQLNIMSDIIKSSVEVQNGDKWSKITGINSTYLSGQGAVFTINSGSSSHGWSSYNFNFVMPEIPDIPAVPSVSRHDDDRFEIEINETVSQALESASQGYERDMDALEDDREQTRELRDQQRDLSYEVRDLEREKRDLEYQMRRADKLAKKEIDKEVKKIEAKRGEIEKARKVLANKSAKLREQQQAQQKKRAKERTVFYQKLSTSLAETLCLYGNGLKALPKDEHVSFIIKAGGKKEGRRYKDKIFVFNKKEISACALDKINVVTLLKKAQVYQY